MEKRKKIRAQRILTMMSIFDYSPLPPFSQHHLARHVLEPSRKRVVVVSCAGCGMEAMHVITGSRGTKGKDLTPIRYF